MVHVLKENSIYSEYVSLICYNSLLSKWTTVNCLGIILLETCMNIRRS